MTREQLIREMIQIELIYQTRQKLLKETSNNDPNDPSDPSSSSSPQQPNSSSQNQITTPTNTPSAPPTKFDFNIIFTNQKGSITADDLYANIKTKDTNSNDTLNPDFIISCKDFYSKKGLVNSQQDEIINDIAKHIIGNSSSITPAEPQVKEYCQSLIEFPFNSISYSGNTNNGTILDKLCNLLNENDFITYINKENSFHSDVYKNITKPDHPMGPGKGEFLVLSIISDAKSGGSKEHDIIFYDNNAQKTGEAEVKQGQSKEDDFRFNINIKRGSAASAARADFMKDLNDFYENFIKSTKQIDKLLDVTGIYESEYIKRNFFNQPTKGVEFKKIGGDLLNYYSSNKTKTDDTDSEDDEETTEEESSEGGIKYTDKQKYRLGAILGFLNDDTKKPTVSGVEVLNTTGSGKTKSGTKESAETVFTLSNIVKDILKNRGENFKDLKNYQIIFDEKDESNKKVPKISIIHDPAEQSNAYTDMEEIFKIVKNKVDAESPFKNTASKNSATASSLSLWINSYFDFIIKKYMSLLDFYKNMLIAINNNFNANNQSMSTVLEEFRSTDIETANWTNWDLFLKIYRGLDIGNQEVAMEFKYYDENGNLVKSKNIVNVVGSEFKIIKPQGLKDIKYFFNRSPQDEDITLQIKNEDISDDEFENIMSTKEAFRFLKDLTSTPTTPKNSKSNMNNSNNINVNNKGILNLLEKAIDSLIKLHTTIYNEYTQNSGGVSAEGILYVATNSKKRVTKFMKPFYKQGINYQQLNDLNNLKNIATPKIIANPQNQTSTTIKPELPLIKDIYPNEKILWCNYIDKSSDEISLLTVLLSLKDKLKNDYLAQISREIVNIKTEIEAIKKSANTIKLSQVPKISKQNLRTKI
jgi:hypothetical protein